jgi:hypothetical protein
MTASRRSVLIGISAWLLISALVALFDPTHLFIRRRDFDKAAAAFHQDPTPGNEAVLRAEQRKNQSIRNEFRVFEAAGLFFGGILCYGAFTGVRFVLSSRNRPAPAKL